MTIATLMATSAIFLVKGWTAPAFGALAITIGGVVCIAASNSGDTSQDLKTGFLIGATPWKQQLALMIGVVVSTVVIGITLNAMNKGLEEFHSLSQPWDISASHSGVQNQGEFTRKSFQITGKSSEPALQGQKLCLAQCAGLVQNWPTASIFTIRRRSRLKCSGCRVSAAKRPRPRRRG